MTFPDQNSPNIKVFHILNGAVDQDGNEEEVRMLTYQIEIFRSNPLNQGKSIAVIALDNLYRAQQQRNKLMLSVIQRIGFEGMLENRVVFCTPDELNGIKRDAVFISMVANTPDPVPPGEDLHSQQAFFAAKSDIFVFHSFRPEKLAPDDERRVFF